MKAAETKVDRFLASNETAFAIPVYQRNYDWVKSQCQQLLKDILDVGGDDDQVGHFIGSIVYVHDDVYSVCLACLPAKAVTCASPRSHLASQHRVGQQRILQPTHRGSPIIVTALSRCNLFRVLPPSNWTVQNIENFRRGEMR